MTFNFFKEKLLICKNGEIMGVTETAPSQKPPQRQKSPNTRASIQICRVTQNRLRTLATKPETRKRLRSFTGSPEQQNKALRQMQQLKPDQAIRKAVGPQVQQLIKHVLKAKRKQHGTELSATTRVGPVTTGITMQPNKQRSPLVLRLGIDHGNLKIGTTYNSSTKEGKFDLTERFSLFGNNGQVNLRVNTNGEISTGARIGGFSTKTKFGKRGRWEKSGASYRLPFQVGNQTGIVEATAYYGSDHQYGINLNLKLRF